MLVDNTAELLRFGGHSGYGLMRYWRATVRDVASALHAPRDLPTPELYGWLRRVGRARGLDADPAKLAEAVQATGRARAVQPRRVVAVARRIHRFRREILRLER